MYTFIIILILVICALLTLIVLIQKPKGGGLSSSFGNIGQQLLGAKNSTDIVEKVTWSLAVIMIVFTVVLTAFDTKKVGATNTTTSTQVQTNDDGVDKAVMNKANKGANAVNPVAPNNSAPVAPAAPTK